MDVVFEPAKDMRSTQSPPLLVGFPRVSNRTWGLTAMGILGTTIPALFSFNGTQSFQFAFAAIVLIALTSVILHWSRNALERRDLRAIEYFLPIVMERIVMAVESGLDIAPAIEVAVNLRVEFGQRDPVTRIFSFIIEMVNTGTCLSDALRRAETICSSPALRHALVHLSIAAREGGAIIHPLRELSDATQLSYQETMEEEVARMPVKATVPLLLTFAGLMILFLTAPIIQVMKVTNQSVPQ